MDVFKMPLRRRGRATYSGPPTPAQKRARKRNWEIYKLRALQNVIDSFAGLHRERRDRIIRIIDRELADMGAISFAEKRNQEDD